MDRLASIAILSGMALMTLCGCGAQRSRPTPVKGTVVYRGQPVEGARVSFYPPSSRPAVGLTDADGTFNLLTWKPGDGAIEGECVVCVGKMQLEAVPDSPYPKGQSLLPEKYLVPMRSPLRATVSLEGTNEFHFVLDD